MARGRPVTRIVLSEREASELDTVARSRTLPYGLVQRARIVLACAEGVPGSRVARRLGVTNFTVGKWRKRYQEYGIQGLHDELRPGRPRTHEDERVAEVINTALQTRPPDGSHWSVRSMADHTGVSKSTVQRWFDLFGVQPHRQRHFKISNDPFFVEKVRDIVGLYLNPPDHAVVLSVDEKTQVQALERSQPVLPMGLGYVEGVTHDYRRHGTTTLFAALDVATGEVLTRCKPRHRHQGGILKPWGLRPYIHSIWETDVDIRRFS
jgi:putative transposase